MLCLNKHQYELGGSNRNRKGTLFEKLGKKKSSVDNLVDMEVWQFSIKDHRNSGFLEGGWKLWRL